MQVRNSLARKGGRHQPPDPPLVPTGQSFDTMGATTAFSRNEEVFGEGEPAEYLYKIAAGCVRTFNTLNDGRRQIGAFYLPGDIFGLEAGARYNVSAESITRSRILAVKRTDIMSRAADDVAMAHLVLDLTTKELQRTQRHILLLLRTAQERVVGFLLEVATHEINHDDFELRMTRQDIADYLGLTIETVSRTLTRLESGSAISLPSSRHIIFCNRPALERLNS